MKRVYETERLLLKILDERHANPVADYFSRNRTFLDEWERPREDAFFEVTYQEKQLRREQMEMKRGKLFKLWLFKKEEEGQIIGSVAFSNILRGPFQSCFLGYRLDRTQLNRGYMTEAPEMGIEIIFRELGLHRIEANIMPRNTPSIHLVEKLGFHQEGLARDYLMINGKWEDHIHMVLLNDKDGGYDETRDRTVEREES